jgi:hypothetical protein
MEHSLPGVMPQAQVLHVLISLAGGSLQTFETLLPRLFEAFPNLLVPEEGVPSMQRLASVTFLQR